MPDKCFLPYSNINIYPYDKKKAIISSCFRNFYYPGNNVIIKSGILEAWNSVSFQQQRSYALQKNTINCKGCPGFHDIIHSKLGLFYDFAAKDPIVKKAIKAKRTILNYQPRTMSIIFSFKCTNNCYHCISSPRSRIHLSKTLINEAFNDIIPYVKFIDISGGEPLLTSINLIKKITHHYKDKKVVIRTNGILLNRSIIKEILNKNTIIMISLYSFEKKSYKKITTVDYFERIMLNIESLLKTNYARHLLIKFVAYEESADFLEEFCNFALKTRDKFYAISVVIDPFSNKKTLDAIKKAKRKYADSGVEFLFANSMSAYNTGFIKLY